MLNRILIAVLVLTIAGLLTLQRFSMPPTMPVRVASAVGENPYGLGESLRRGSIVQTSDGFLRLVIGSDDPTQALVQVWLAEKTTITLERLYEDGLVVRLVRGRIVADSQAEYPLRIETNFTSHLIHKGSASFVNYDFLETVHVIPLEGSVQVAIGDEFLLTPSPLSIHETAPVTYEALAVNLEAGDAADFYQWVGLTPKTQR